MGEEDIDYPREIGGSLKVQKGLNRLNRMQMGPSKRNPVAEGKGG